MSGTGQSVMVHQFSQVPNVNVPRSTFDRSHGVKTTINFGDLVPIFVDEVLPGDTFHLNMTSFGRLTTPLKPIMDNIFMDYFFFFVPYRLVWTHFVNMFGEQNNPADSTSFLVPTQTAPAGGYAELSLHDYFGLPTKQVGIVHSSLPLRAYNLIWHQWFRDQNLQNAPQLDVGDGPDTPANYTVLKRGKRHDYFTSALPNPQKGPAVSIPLGTSAPVTITAPTTGLGGGHQFVRDVATGALRTAQTAWTTTAGGSPQTSPAGAEAYLDPNGTLSGSANLSAATAATINQLRQAFATQQLLEQDARGGTRYIELIKAHFGVTSPDARLQRPEYLGGGSVPFNVNPIAQTSGSGATGQTTPQGNLAAMGTVHTRGIGFGRSFTEHGVIIGLVSCRSDMTYQQGLEKFWSRSTRLDFYWPALAHIGEQSVLNGEIFAVGSNVPGQDALTFGYQERYAEYRFKPSRIMGRFRSNCTTPLDFWHLAFNFGALPVLNASFIQEAPPISRIVAVTTEPHVLLDLYFGLRCARPMPVYSVPGLRRL